MEHTCPEHICAASVPIFADLGLGELARLHEVIVSRTYPKGALIVAQGDAGGSLHIVRTGRVKINRISPQGKEQILRFLEPGDIFGELSLFSEEPLPFNAEALAPTSICTIQKEHVENILRENPEAALKVIRALSHRLSEAEQLIEDLGIKNSEQRVISLLLQLAAKLGRKDPQGSITIELLASREELAHLIGTTQETLSRRLSSLEEDGLIAIIGQKRIILKDPAALEERQFE